MGGQAKPEERRREEEERRRKEEGASFPGDKLPEHHFKKKYFNAEFQRQQGEQERREGEQEERRREGRGGNHQGPPRGDPRYDPNFRGPQHYDQGPPRQHQEHPGPPPRGRGQGQGPTLGGVPYSTGPPEAPDVRRWRSGLPWPPTGTPRSEQG